MEKNIIILTGIPGVGKTTILKLLTKTHHDLMVFNYGDEMLQIAQGQNIERAALRKLPIHEQQAIGVLAAQKIVGKAKGITLIDTHALIKTPIGFVPGIPSQILQILKPTGIVIFESTSFHIQERRQKDKSHPRDTNSLQEIEYHQNLCRSFITACSSMLGAVLIPIHNDQEPSQAVNKLEEVIQFFKA